jgi:hypothetical protein
MFVAGRMFTNTMAALTETPAIAPTAAGWGSQLVASTRQPR